MLGFVFTFSIFFMLTFIRVFKPLFSIELRHQYIWLMDQVRFRKVVLIVRIDKQECSILYCVDDRSGIFAGNRRASVAFA